MPSPIQLLTNSKIYKRIFNSRLLNKKLYSSSNPKPFLLAEMKADRFNRYDTIVRLLAVENHFKKNNFGWDLYLKMQETRQAFQNKHVKSLDQFKVDFEKLITSMDKNGYDTAYPIITNTKGKLSDGSHRLACALYFEVPEVSLKKDPTDNSEVVYNIDWFQENGFSVQEIEHLKNRLQKIAGQ